MQWIELDDEEDVDRQAAHLFMRKYAKLWRNIFSKYANAGYKVLPLNERGSFEGLNKASESITLAEIMKMCKDHNLLPSLLSKDDAPQGDQAIAPPKTQTHALAIRVSNSLKRSQHFLVRRSGLARK